MLQRYNCCKDTESHNRFVWIAHLIVCKREEKLAHKPFQKRFDRKTMATTCPQTFSKESLPTNLFKKGLIEKL